MIPERQWAPRYVLNARGRHPEFSQVASILDGREDLQRGQRMALVLIHGFANRREDAEKAYDALLRNLEDLEAVSCGGRTARLADQVDVFAFHWPGDHPGDRWDGVLSAVPVRSIVSFGARVAAADGAGKLLASALLRSGRERVVIVAHSLGCRVALSALVSLRDLAAGKAGKVVQAHLVLMAAAVPVGECDFGDFACGKQPAEARCSVMYSPRDWVLRYTFPPGQAGVDRSDEAVGLYGRPDQGRWHGSLRTGNSHGAYWRSPETARQVLGVMAYDQLRRVGERSLGPLPSLPGRRLPTRELPERRLRERRLRTRIGEPEPGPWG